MPFHFAEASANKLTNSAFDDVTKTGEYKIAAARVEATQGKSPCGRILSEIQT